MKTIGVLGGLGPQATMDFEARVHSIAQRLTPQPAGNSGYPPMLVYFYRDAPVLMADTVTPVLPMHTNPLFLEAARRLSAADFLVITSNGVHAMQAEIEAAAGRPVLSMIDATLDEIKRRGWTYVGLLGFIQPRVYQMPLDDLGLRHTTIAPDLQHRLNHAIQKYMAGQDTDADRAVAREAVATLRAQGVDGVVLGCTEIPLLLGQDADAPDLINPLEYLAEAAVRHALE